MEDNKIATKRHKKRKIDRFYAPFASFRGYFFTLCVAYVAALSVGLFFRSWVEGDGSV